ncbi:hypothetical protein [Brevundimonas sp. FT23042]|uniref:hypothetical protein n=1 Tax=Brevundimonas sp. FT23042 TaxID=3393749 RepID=UPI003B58607E
MTGPGLARLVRLAIWGGVALATFVGLVVVLDGLGVRWDPLGFGARRLARAEAQAALAESQARARALETEATADQARRLELHHQQAIGLARITAAAEASARTAPDADDRLEPDRAGRIRAHDRELCALAPTLCVGAPPDPARAGSVAVPPGSPAGSADESGS